MNKKRFTLIEFITVIVIAVTISVLAIPKYVNMQKEAADSMAHAGFSAAQLSCNINFINGKLGKSGHQPITDAGQIIPLMADQTQWVKNDVNYLRGDIGKSTYFIQLTASEDKDSIAVLKLYHLNSSNGLDLMVE